MSHWKRTRPHASLGRGIGLLVLVAVGCGGGAPAVDDRAPRARPGSPEWTRSSEPLVRAFLSTLSPLVIGQPLDGIRLSDDERWFEGDIYLGRPTGTPAGLFVVMLKHEGETLAYMWAEPEAEPFELEGCDEEHKPGIRARRLSGHVHTWKTVRPEHGVVYTECPPETWIPPGAASPGADDAAEGLPIDGSPEVPDDPGD